MFHRLYTKWRKRAPITVATKEVEIPVGGITPDGIIYEKEVKPYGDEPIYRQVRVDGDSNDTKEEKEDKPDEDQERDTTSK